MAASAAVVTGRTWLASERMKLQLGRIRDKQYKPIGLLTTIVTERQMSTRGMSQSRGIDRCSNPRAVKELLEQGKMRTDLLPFSAWQSHAWSLMTLEYLHHKNAPLLCISSDRNDLLLPFGLRPLPDIPDPAFVPGPVLVGGKAKVAPRIPQKLEDRACGQIRERNGRLWLIFQPLSELCVMVGGQTGEKGAFGRIKCETDPADRTHAALLVDPEPVQIRIGSKVEGCYPAHFIGGCFQAG